GRPCGVDVRSLRSLAVGGRGWGTSCSGRDRPCFDRLCGKRRGDALGGDGGRRIARRRSVSPQDRGVSRGEGGIPRANRRRGGCAGARVRPPPWARKRLGGGAAPLVVA